MSVDRDERTVAVENASYRWGYLVMSFGLLVLVAYRSFARGESSWDLLALVIVGGMVPSAYQGASNVLTRRWTMTQIAAMTVAAILAAILVFLRR
jgi:hypothetical protein